MGSKWGDQGKFLKEYKSHYRSHNNAILRQIRQCISTERYSKGISTNWKLYFTLIFFNVMFKCRYTDIPHPSVSWLKRNDMAEKIFPFLFAAACVIFLCE